MKIVFMGTPDFAVECLRALLDAGYEVAAVFTQPDKPARRGMKLQSSPVKVLAEERGIRLSFLSTYQHCWRSGASPSYSR